MNTRAIEAAARLVEARRTSVQIEALDPGEQPRSLEEGYTIQSAAIEAWPDEIAGWKVGATSLEIQKLFGISEPIYGPVFAKTVFESPVAVRAAQFPHRLLESEFTFRFGRRLSAHSSRYSRAEVMDSVEALIPSFELVNPRFPSLTISNIPQLVADFCANGGAILGSPCLTWQSLDLCSQSVRLLIDGHEQQAGTGRLVLGDPINVLEWFVDKFTGQGGSIEAGQFVMTGTITGLHAPLARQRANARFHSLGDVVVMFE